MEVLYTTQQYGGMAHHSTVWRYCTPLNSMEVPYTMHSTVWRYRTPLNSMEVPHTTQQYGGTAHHSTVWRYRTPLNSMEVPHTTQRYVCVYMFALNKLQRMDELFGIQPAYSANTRIHVPTHNMYTPHTCAKFLKASNVLCFTIQLGLVRRDWNKIFIRVQN